MNPRARWAVLISGVLLAGGPAAADVYTWVDAQGTVHFQDGPPAAGARGRKVKLPDEEPRSIPPEEDVAPRRDGPARGAEPQERSSTKLSRESGAAPSVELYTTSWCPWCKKAREYFRSRGISFTDHDIEKESGALQRKLGVDGDKHVPTAIIGGKVVKGYSPAGYEAALQER